MEISFISGNVAPFTISIWKRNANSGYGAMPKLVYNSMPTETLRIVAPFYALSYYPNSNSMSIDFDIDIHAVSSPNAEIEIKRAMIAVWPV